MQKILQGCKVIHLVTKSINDDIVTIQCNVVIPYFGWIRILIASLSNVKYGVMLLER